MKLILEFTMSYSAPLTILNPGAYVDLCFTILPALSATVRIDILHTDPTGTLRQGEHLSPASRFFTHVPRARKKGVCG